MGEWVIYWKLTKVIHYAACYGNVFFKSIKKVLKIRNQSCKAITGGKGAIHASECPGMKNFLRITYGWELRVFIYWYRKCGAREDELEIYYHELSANHRLAIAPA